MNPSTVSGDCHFRCWGGILHRNKISMKEQEDDLLRAEATQNNLSTYRCKIRDILVAFFFFFLSSHLSNKIAYKYLGWRWMCRWKGFRGWRGSSISSASILNQTRKNFSSLLQTKQRFERAASVHADRSLMWWVVYLLLFISNFNGSLYSNVNKAILAFH